MTDAENPSDSQASPKPPPPPPDDDDDAATAAAAPTLAQDPGVTLPSPHPAETASASDRALPSPPSERANVVLTDSPGAVVDESRADRAVYVGCVALLVIGIVAAGVIAALVRSNQAPAADDAQWVEARAWLVQIDEHVEQFSEGHGGSLKSLYAEFERAPTRARPVVLLVPAIATRIGLDLNELNKLGDFAASDFHVVVTSETKRHIEVVGSLPTSPKGTLRRNTDGTFTVVP